jgi:glucose/arabinose dehydrogenase
MVRTARNHPRPATTFAAVLLAAAGLALISLSNRPVMVSASTAAQQTPLVENLRVPPGFRVGLFASGLGAARFMAFSPAGELYVTSRDLGAVFRLRDANRDGVADESTVFVGGAQPPPRHHVP